MNRQSIENRIKLIFNDLIKCKKSEGFKEAHINYYNNNTGIGISVNYEHETSYFIFDLNSNKWTIYLRTGGIEGGEGWDDLLTSLAYYSPFSVLVTYRYLEYYNFIVYLNNDKSNSYNTLFLANKLSLISNINGIDKNFIHELTILNMNTNQEVILKLS